MNFKDWEKLAEDDKSVKLRHPKGHEMTIALKALPKIQQEMVKRLKFAKGGDVLDSGEDGESEQGKTVRHANKTKADLKQAKEEAKGRAQMEKTVKPKLKGLAQGGVAHYDEGTPDQPVSQQDEAKPQDQASPPPVVVNVNGAQAPTPQAPPAPQPPVQMPSSGTSPVAMPEQVKMAEPKQINGSSLGNEANQSLQSIEDAKTGLDNEAKVKGALSQAAIPVLQQKIKGEQQYQQGLQNNTNMITQQVQQFNDATKGGIINPKNYQESMGSGQKVRTAIGLFLGGMGVPFGGQNYAFEHLEKQIDRDIAAQQNTFQNRKSVLGAWQSLYGENQIALNLAKASLIDNTANQLDLQAKALGTQSALNNAAAGKQVLMEKSAQLRNEAASLATKAGINGTPPGKAAPPPGASNEAPKEKHPLQETILGPDAERKLALAQFDPILKGKMPELMSQYTAAQQADIALGKINETFLRLSKGAEEGGLGGRMRRRVSPHVLGGIGTALGAGIGSLAGGVGAIPGGAIGGAAGEALGKAGEAVTDTDTNRAFDSAQTELKGYLSSALASTTVGGGAAIDDIVAKNSPEYGDSAKTKAHKLKTIRDFVIEHTPRSLLQMGKMTKR